MGDDFLITTHGENTSDVVRFAYPRIHGAPTFPTAVLRNPLKICWPPHCRNDKSFLLVLEILVEFDPLSESSVGSPEGASEQREAPLQQRPRSVVSRLLRLGHGPNPAWAGVRRSRSD